MATNTKKTTKKTVKKTKFTPEIVVDLTNAIDPFDVYLAFANTKCNKYLSHTEYIALANQIVSDFTDLCAIMCCGTCEIKEEKKPNIFKRFWNWITRKK